MMRPTPPYPVQWRHWSIGPYPYIVGDDFLATLPKIRTLYLSGYLGGGKTLLAYYLAMYALSRGWVRRIVSNIPSPLSCAAEDVDDIRDSAVILDEAWQFLSERSEAISYGAALRKLGVLLLMPSVFPPSAVLAAFSCQRFINGYIFGIPVWGYRFFLNFRAFRERGTFWLINPHLVAGWYDTEAYPAEDYGIQRRLDEAVIRLKAETAARLGRQRRISPKEVSHASPPPAPPPAGAAATDITAPLEAVAEQFADAAEAISAAARRLPRR